MHFKHAHRYMISPNKDHIIHIGSFSLVFLTCLFRISTKYLSKKYISNLVYNNIVHLLISSYKLIICEVTTREKFILLNLSKKYGFLVPLSKLNEEYVFNFFNRILGENIYFPYLIFCVLSYSTHMMFCFVYLINN